MKKIYRVIFTLKVPSSVGTKLDFRTLASDIIYAIHEFNKKFNFKEVKLVTVRTQEIELLFSINIQSGDVAVNARDLSVFSKRLYHDRGWSIYSRENTKLFTATLFKDITTINFEKYSKFPVVPMDLLKRVTEDVSQDINSQLDDVQAVNAFQGLIGIQDVGDEETRLIRKRAILEIKRILLSTLSK